MPHGARRGGHGEKVLHMKRGFLRSNWLAALVVLAVCGGCGGDTGPDNPGQTRPGMGPSKARPEGTAYTLPAGVQLEQPIKGYDFFCVPEEQEEKEEKGSGGMVRLCLRFTNTTSQPITVTLPPGLIFISDKETTQNGLLIQVVTLEIPAQQQLFVPLYLYCLNKDRDITKGPQDTYSLGPVTQDGALRELLGLVQNKPLPLIDQGTVQAALWNITDGQGLTAADRDAISRL
jgi:hypothetical protein